MVSIGNGLPAHDRRPMPASKRFSEWRNLTYSRFSRAARASRFDPGWHNEDRPRQGPDIDNIYSSLIRSMERSKERGDTFGRGPTDSPLFDYFSTGFVEPCPGIGICENRVPRCGCKVTYGRCPLWNVSAQAKWLYQEIVSSTLRFYIRITLVNLFLVVGRRMEKNISLASLAFLYNRQ